MVVGEADVWQGEIRIQREGLLETLTATLRVLGCEAPLVVAVSEIVRVWRQARHPALGRERQLQLQRTGNRGRDVVLHREDIRELAVVALRPEMGAVASEYQLRRDTNA